MSATTALSAVVPAVVRFGILESTPNSCVSSVFALFAKVKSWAGVTGWPNSLLALASQTTQTAFA